MPTESIVFGTQESGDAQLAGAPPLAINVLLDGKGAVRRRPGISAWSGQGSVSEDSPIRGIASFEGEVYYVNDLRRIHKLSSSGDTSLSPGPTAALLDGTGRPVFAETQWRLVIAGGGLPQMVNSGATTSARLGSVTYDPPVCNGVIATNGRIFVDDQTDSSSLGQIRFSGLGVTNNKNFDPLDYVTADARPDALVSLRENSNEVYAFGSTSLQVFSPDPVGVLAPSRSMNAGIGAGHSVVRTDVAFFWLDEQKQIRGTDGRNMQVASAAISGTLDAISTISDCWGFRVNIDRFDVAGFKFPTDGRTFVYQQGGGWSQWQGWTDGRGHVPFPITAHYYWPAADTHLVGLSSGQIGMLDIYATTDLGDRIKAEVLTGFMDHQTDGYKHCESVALSFQRGASSSAPSARLSWRDDGGAFCDPVSIDLGAYGDRYPVVEKRSLGRYRRRQWKIEMTDAADMVLAGVRETYTAA